MTEIGTKKFDELLQTNISHYKNYPEMLPFIGSKWEQSKKILLIGESHYIPYGELQEVYNTDYFSNWYNLNSQKFNENYKSYITTRKNFETVKSGKVEKPLMLYFNLQKAIKEISHFKNSEFVFDEFSYYNYFQKPASVKEVKGENRSINPTKEDKEFAFETFEKIIKTLKPQCVVFVSKKSFNAFAEMQSKQSIEIDFVPHAGRQWWNRKSKVYNNRTGKQKFIDILTSCYNK